MACAVYWVVRIAPLAGAQLSEVRLSVAPEDAQRRQVQFALPFARRNCTAEYIVSSTANGAAARVPEYEVPPKSGQPESAFRFCVTVAVPVLNAD